MSNNKKGSKKTKKNDSKNEQFEQKRVYLFHDVCHSNLPGVVETSSLGEIKKPKKSDESHNDGS